MVSSDFLTTDTANGARRKTCTACLSKRKREYAAERARDRALARVESVQADTEQGRSTATILSVTVYTEVPVTCPKCAEEHKCHAERTYTFQGVALDVSCWACGWSAPLEEGR